MKVSLNWLKNFVEIPDDLSPEKLAELLTLKVVEVEGIQKQSGNLENIVVGKIKKIENHPDADKLKVCLVDIGESDLKRIICGGINTREGMYVAVAKIGAKVKWHGKGELVEIQKTKIRGVESEGMICSSLEIGLENVFPAKGEREVIDLQDTRYPPKWRADKIQDTNKFQISNFKFQTENLKVGMPLAEVLEMQDVILEVDNKSLTNRPDLWGHIGIAREVSAILGVNFKFQSASWRTNFKSLKIKRDSADLKERLLVKVENFELCPRYTAVSISGIKIGPSPEWMQKRLLAVGMRPINNIVDITNYAMLETGQPMHAFDKLKIIRRLANQKSKMNEIIIRAAKAGEVITTLDGAERRLDENMLVIADSEKPIAIAGVMGGENSEVGENTTDIILESANFEKVNNRKTAAKLGLRTEASMRYEKGLDPNLTEYALARCAGLIKEIIPEAEISSDIIDMGRADAKPAPEIELSIDYINKKIGAEIPPEKIIQILESLGFAIKSENSQVLNIQVPSWRAAGDISGADDIIEEIARIYGYDKIEPEMPLVAAEPPLENKERKLERKIKNILSAGFGMAETSNYSFVNEKQAAFLGLDLDEHIKLANSLSSEHTLLRTSLIPNLLLNAAGNLRYFDKFKMFEIGSVFKNQEGNMPMGGAGGEDLPWQEKFVSGIIVELKNSIPFYEAKNIAEGLLNALGIDFEVLAGGEMEKWMHPYRKSEIRNPKSEIHIGYAAEISPAAAEKIGIKNARAGVFDLSLKALLELAQEQAQYKKISRFPAVLRDIALVADKNVLAYNIHRIIKEAGGDILKEIEFFDYYEGPQLPDGKKSLAYHLVFQSDERTLEDKEADEVVEKIIGRLDEELGIALRK